MLVAGTIQVEVLFYAYVRRIARFGGHHVYVLHTATVGKVDPYGNGLLVTVIAACGHTIGIRNGTVRPLAGSGTRHGDDHRVAQADGRILVKGIGSIVNHHVLADFAIVAVHGKQGTQHIGLRIVGNVHTHAVRSRNQGVGRIEPTIAYPFLLVRLDRYHAALAAEYLVGHTRIDGRQYLHLHRSGLAVAGTHGLDGAEDIVAFFQSAYVVRITPVNDVLQRKIAEPGNRALTFRFDFQGTTWRTGTIDGVADKHARRIGRIVGVQFDRIVNVAAGNRANRYGIRAVGQIDEIGVRSEVLRNESGIFERGVARGVNADDTVHPLAGRRHHLVDTIYDGNRAHEHFHFHHAALAVAELLVEIVDMTAGSGGEHHGVARMDHRVATIIGEPFHLCLLGLGIEHQVGRQHVGLAIEARIGNHRIHRTVGIAQTDLQFLAAATVIVAHIGDIHAGSQVLETVHRIGKPVEIIGIGLMSTGSDEGDATVGGSASLGIGGLVGKPGRFLHAQVNDLRRHRVGVHTLGDDTLRGEEGLDTVAGIYLFYPEDAVARDIMACSGRSAHHHFEFLLQTGEVGHEPDLGRIVPAARGIHQDDVEIDRIDDMQRHGRTDGIGLATTRDMQAVLVAVFGHIHIPYQQLRRVQVGIFVRIGNAVPAAAFQFLPIINQIQARNFHREAGLSRLAGINVRSLGRGRRYRMNIDVYLVVHHATLAAEERDVVDRRGRRPCDDRLRRLLGISPRKDLVLGRPGETVDFLALHHKLDGSTRTDGAVGRDLADDGDRIDMNAYLGRIDRILGRTGIAHGHLAMNAATVARCNPVFGGTVVTGIQGIVHIPTVHAYPARVGVILNLEPELVERVGAIVRVAHQYRLAEHALVDGNLDGLHYRIHTVEHPYPVIGHTYRTYRADNGRVGTHETSIGRRAVLRNGRPGKTVQARTTPRRYLEAYRVAFANDMILDARVELASLEADDMAVRSLATMRVGGRKRIRDRRLDRRGKRLELIHRSFDLAGGRPEIGHRSILARLHARAEECAAQGIARIVLYDDRTVGTGVNLRILVSRHPYDGRRFGIQGRTFVSGGNESLDRRAVLAQFLGQHITHALAHLPAHAIHSPIHGVIGGQVVLGLERESYRRTLADGIGSIEQDRTIGGPQRIDIQTSHAVELLGIVRIERIAFLGLVGNAAHPATILVLAHAKVEMRKGGTYTVFGQTDFQRGRETARPYFLVRIGTGHVLDRTPYPVALIHLPVEGKGGARSTYLEPGHRTVANRDRLRMIEHTYVGIDFYQDGILHLTMPRFGKRHGIARGGARGSGDIGSLTCIERRTRRPFVLGPVATATDTQVDRFAQVDFLRSGNVQHGLILYHETKRVRDLGTAIHAMNAGNQQQTDAVAVLQGIEHDKIGRTAEQGIVVAKPDKRRIVAFVHVRGTDPDRIAATNGDAVQCLVDVAGDRHVHRLLFIHRRTNGFGHIRTGIHAFQRRVDGSGYVETIVHACQLHYRVARGLPDGIAVDAPFEQRAVAPAVTAQTEYCRIAETHAFVRHIRNDTVDNGINGVGNSSHDHGHGRRQILGIGTAGIYGHRIGTRHLGREPGPEHTHAIPTPTIGTFPDIRSRRHAIGLQEQRISDTNSRIGINLVLRGIARQTTFGETVGETTDIERIEDSRHLQGNMTVGDTAHIRPRLGLVHGPGMVTITDTTQEVRRKKHLHGRGNMTVTDTAHERRCRQILHGRGRMTIADTTQEIRRINHLHGRGNMPIADTTQVRRLVDHLHHRGRMTVADTAQVRRLVDHLHHRGRMTVADTAQVRRLVDHLHHRGRMTVADTTQVRGLVDHLHRRGRMAVTDAAQVRGLIDNPHSRSMLPITNTT